MLKKFRSFLNEERKVELNPLKEGDGVYIGVYLDAASEKLLEEWSKENGIKKPEHDGYHSTVIYSKPDKTPSSSYENIEKLISELQTVPEIRAKITGLDILGTNKDCLVFRVESSQLNKMNEIALKYGLVSDFPKYLPHITLAFKEPEVIQGFKHRFERIKIPDLPLAYSRIKIEHAKDY